MENSKIGKAGSKLSPELEDDLICLGVQGITQKVTTGQTDVAQADFNKYSVG